MLNYVEIWTNLSFAMQDLHLLRPITKIVLETSTSQGRPFLRFRMDVKVEISVSEGKKTSRKLKLFQIHYKGNFSKMSSAYIKRTGWNYAEGKSIPPHLESNTPHTTPLLNLKRKGKVGEAWPINAVFVSPDPGI